PARRPRASGQRAGPRAVRDGRRGGRREGVGQGPARRPGERVEPGRRPARAVVEVRSPDVSPAGRPEPAADRRPEPPHSRPRPAPAVAQRGTRRPTETLALGDRDGDRRPDRRNLGGEPARSNPPGPRGGTDDMSTELRQALIQVARRFRLTRLWGSLALCW